MACTLPDDWVIMLISHKSMRKNILSEFSDLLRSGKLRVWELSTSVRTIRELCPNFEVNDWCDSASTTETTEVLDNEIDLTPWPTDWSLSNQIWYSMNVHRAIPTPYFLIFQTDGLLCRPLTAEYIDALRNYDYVGAPWNNTGGPWLGTNRSIEKGVGGNGGISFRNRDLILTILEKWKGRHTDLFEDVFFSFEVYDIGGKLPSMDFARSFSVETTPFEDPVAFHKPWRWLERNALRTLSTNCPVVQECQMWSSLTSVDAKKIKSCLRK
jgi:hypothetical protein